MRPLYTVKIYSPDGECVSDVLLGISSLLEELTYLPVGSRVEVVRQRDEDSPTTRKMPRG